MGKSHIHHEPLEVEDLPANAKLNIYPNNGYDACVVLIPNRDAGNAPGSSFIAVLFVNRNGVPAPGIAYTVPNQAGCCLVHLNGFFTGEKPIEKALASAGKPGPPVIVT